MIAPTAATVSPLPVHIPDSGKLRLAARWCLLCLILVFLTACKIVIIVPAGGRVVSVNGVVCLTGGEPACIIEVTDDTYDDTFTAIPDEGFVFVGWKKDTMCGGGTDPCRLYTTSFGPFQVLLDVLATDAEFTLEPVFVSNMGYDTAYWSNLLAQIAKGTHATDAFLYSLAPNVGGCDPGSLTQPAKDRARTVLNQIRALFGLDAAAYDSFYDMQVQEASLVQIANNYLSHFPSPGDSCYSASADTGAGTSNLTTGSAQGDPASNFIGWANDNRNVAELMAAGHRRWVLYPCLDFVSYGQVIAAAAQKVFEFGQTSTQPSTDHDYVAFPSNTVPYVLVNNDEDPTPWSISMVPSSCQAAPFDYFASATVSVKNKDTGAPLTTTNRYSDTQGFGLSNFLSWLVPDFEYNTRYTVTISGIRIPGGGVRTVEYDALMDTSVLFLGDLEAGDKHQGNSLLGVFNTDKDRDPYEVSLSGMESIAGSNPMFSNQGFFILVYDSNKELVKSSDVPFSMMFDAGTYTIVASPCSDDGGCYPRVPSYTVTY